MVLGGGGFLRERFPLGVLERGNAGRVQNHDGSENVVMLVVSLINFLSAGVACDSGGMLYVTDRDNNRIQVLCRQILKPEP